MSVGAFLSSRFSIDALSIHDSLTVNIFLKPMGPRRIIKSVSFIDMYGILIDIIETITTKRQYKAKMSNK